MTTPMSTATPPESPATPPPRTSRLILWAAILATVVVLILRLSGTLFERITVNQQVHDLAADLEDPALAELAVRLGVMLAIVISAVFQIIYLFLCATVDEKLLVGLMVRVGHRPANKGRLPAIGPAVVVGIGATLPVQLTALMFGLTAPKESPFFILWLVVLVTIVTVWAWKRPALRDRGASGRILLLAVLIIIAAISFLL